MPVNAGDMRHRVSIQQRVTLKDGAGETLEQWNEVMQRYAALTRTPGTEVWASAQRNARVPTIFELRYEDTVVPGMRLIFSGKTYNIKSAIDPTGRKEKLVITTEELVVG